MYKEFEKLLINCNEVKPLEETPLFVYNGYFKMDDVYISVRAEKIHFYKIIYIDYNKGSNYETCAIDKDGRAYVTSVVQIEDFLTIAPTVIQEYIIYNMEKFI